MSRELGVALLAGMSCMLAAAVLLLDGAAFYIVASFALLVGVAGVTIPYRGRA